MKVRKSKGGGYDWGEHACLFKRGRFFSVRQWYDSDTGNIQFVGKVPVY